MTYKKYHEDYMKNAEGTTALQTFLLIYPSFLEISFATFLFVFVLNEFKLKSNKQKQTYHFLLDYSVIVFPITLRITVLGQFSAFIIQLLLVLNFYIVYKIVTTFPTQTKTVEVEIQSKRHFISNVRPIINIITAVAILAVDFTVFPRQYAKTERYGYSLMDLGVGLFIFGNGIVAPEVNKKPESLTKSLVSTVPLLLLGSARFFITKEIDYQVQVSEYGVHWNFFITLAVTKILSSVVLVFISVDYSMYISIFVLIVHEVILALGASDWVFSDLHRDDFITSNREGIVSSLGYVGLYFLAVYFGKNMTISKETQSDTRILVNLVISSIVLLILSGNLENKFGISRKLANSAYCTWIMFLGLVMTSFFILGENILRYIYKNFYSVEDVYVPILCEAVNFNQLTFFILANILTGVINVMIQTLYVEPFLSLLIINVYMLIVCGVTHLLYVNNVKMKYW